LTKEPSAMPLPVSDAIIEQYSVEEKLDLLARV
jgi:hypothetical protein